MRKILISVLLASAVATPAWAGPREDRQAAREDRQEAREQRRANRPTVQSNNNDNGAAGERVRVREERVEVREPRQVQVAPRKPAQQPNVRIEERRQVIDQRIDDRDQRRAERQQDRVQDRVVQRQVIRQGRGAQLTPQQRLEQSRERFQAIRDARRNAPPPVISPTPRPGTQPPPPTNSRPTRPVNWDYNHWRHDKRYDWYKHRNKYWWLYQLGWYYDPFGWGYQPYSIGWRMWPSYYSSNYWLNDPWEYRLPYAPPGTRWIRYYNDAILVDTWSGQVVDVIYDFFW